MHEYDIALKTFLRNSGKSLVALTSTAIDHWHNAEMPAVSNRRADLLGETADGRLIHIELQSTNDANMALRMVEYFIAIYRQFGRFPEQVVLYVGEAPLRMTGNLSGPNCRFDCRIVDIRELDGERLLESDQIGDNIIGVLARVNDQREAVKRILGRIAALDSAERGRAFAGFIILAGLRKLGKVIEQEVHQMPLLDDIMDHEVLGPKIRRAQEQGLAEGLAKGLAKGLVEGLAEGRAEGRAEGLEKGRHDGEIALLFRQIERRFGSVPATLQERFAKMSIPEVESVAIRLLDARSVEDLLV